MKAGSCGEASVASAIETHVSGKRDAL